jgi:hypothetical protein
MRFFYASSFLISLSFFTSYSLKAMEPDNAAKDITFWDNEESFPSQNLSFTLSHLNTADSCSVRETCKYWLKNSTNLCGFSDAELLAWLDKAFEQMSDLEIIEALKNQVDIKKRLQYFYNYLRAQLLDNFDVITEASVAQTQLSILHKLIFILNFRKISEEGLTKQLIPGVQNYLISRYHSIHCICYKFNRNGYERSLMRIELSMSLIRGEYLWAIKTCANPQHKIAIFETFVASSEQLKNELAENKDSALEALADAYIKLNYTPQIKDLLSNMLINGDFPLAPAIKLAVSLGAKEYNQQKRGLYANLRTVEQKLEAATAISDFLGLDSRLNEYDKAYFAQEMVSIFNQALINCEGLSLKEKAASTITETLSRRPWLNKFVFDNSIHAISERIYSVIIDIIEDININIHSLGPDRLKLIIDLFRDFSTSRFFEQLLPEQKKSLWVAHLRMLEKMPNKGEENFSGVNNRELQIIKLLVKLNRLEDALAMSSPINSIIILHEVVDTGDKDLVVIALENLEINNNSFRALILEGWYLLLKNMPDMLQLMLENKHIQAELNISTEPNLLAAYSYLFYKVQRYKEAQCYFNKLITLLQNFHLDSAKKQDLMIWEGFCNEAKIDKNFIQQDNAQIILVQKLDQMFETFKDHLDTNQHW